MTSTVREFAGLGWVPHRIDWCLSCQLNCTPGERALHSLAPRRNFFDDGTVVLSPRGVVSEPGNAFLVFISVARMEGGARWRM